MGRRSYQLLSCSLVFAISRADVPDLVRFFSSSRPQPFSEPDELLFVDADPIVTDSDDVTLLSPVLEQSQSAVTPLPSADQTVACSQEA